jgi:hypothetical protein
MPVEFGGSNIMRRPLIVLTIFALGILEAGAGPNQDRPRPVSLVELIANPDHFDGKLLVVKGFLVAAWSGHDNHGTASLFLTKESADNLLDANVLVRPNERMRRDEEKIDRMYVVLTGYFHAVPAENGAFIAEIKDVQDCNPWSDPNHPIGLRQDRPRSK